MDNPERLATLSTQDTRQTKQKTQHRINNVISVIEEIQNLLKKEKIHGHCYFAIKLNPESLHYYAKRYYTWQSVIFP